MRILISDYSGHPFQVQLSRELARRGHVVTHTYSAGFQTPKGKLTVSPDDPPGFDIVPVRNRKAFAKASFVKRRSQEIEIGKELAKLVAAFRPNVVISSNAPLDTQRYLQRAARANGASFVFWVQDIYSKAISRIVPEKFPVVGHLVAAWYRSLEFDMLRKSDKVIVITEDFVPILLAQGVRTDRVATIENWAPLDELPRHARDNDWASSNMPGERIRIVYSGTLGYKHNPRLLTELARALPDAQVHVFSEGEVVNALRVQARTEGLDNLAVHPWVAFEDLPLMLSGADMFVAVIEPEAGVYSVPSKVLTYLGIGRPILASVPAENLAARLIVDNDAGFAAPPGQDDALIARARQLAGDPQLRKAMGNNGRGYATRTFDIAAIADKFCAAIETLET